MSLLNLYHSHCCPLVSLQLTCIFLQHLSWPQVTYLRHNLTQKSYCYNCYLMSIHTYLFAFLTITFSLYFLWRLTLNPSSFLKICCLPFCFLRSLLFLQKGRNFHFFPYCIAFYFSRLFLQFINTVVIVILSSQTRIAQLVNLIHVFSTLSCKSQTETLHSVQDNSCKHPLSPSLKFNHELVIPTLLIHFFPMSNVLI